MDLVLKGRGVRITEQMKKTAEAKLAKIERIDPRVSRVEIEVVLEHNPRIEGNHVVEVSCTRGRGVLRAHAAGRDLDGPHAVGFDPHVTRHARCKLTWAPAGRSRLGLLVLFC